MNEPTPETDAAGWEEEIDTLQKQCDELRHKLTTAGIAELSVDNHNLSSYMKHWESRAEKAEAELAALKKQKITDLRNEEDINQQQ